MARNCICCTSDGKKAASKPCTWYSAMYTERYMTTPAANAAGYQDTQVPPRATAILPRADVLLVHGTDDSNVHLTHSVVMLSEIQKVSVDLNVALMVYPHSGHESFFDFGTRPLELFARLERFFGSHLLGTGPDDPEVAVGAGG